MSTGADNKTMPVTKEYEDGYERTFGKREPVRGTWVQHPVTGEMVPADQYEPPAAEAKSAPIMAGRFYENSVAIDGKTDIGSRKRYREYLKETGYTHASDFSPQTIEKARKDRDAKERKELRETVARTAYERWKP